MPFYSIALFFKLLIFILRIFAWEHGVRKDIDSVRCLDWVFLFTVS